MVKMSIITPCSRPENLRVMLKAIKREIAEYFDVQWYIVFDADELQEPMQKANIDVMDFVNSGARISAYKGEGISGNPQRNRALNFMEPTDFVYFLDDDTLPFGPMFKLVSTADRPNIGFIFQQRWPNGILRLPARPDFVKPTYIDTAQFILPYDYIGDSRWDPHDYCADGHFFTEIYNKYPHNFVFINNVWCWYNYLRQ